MTTLIRSLVIFAALLALSLIAMHPFMADALPTSADGALHLYRLVALDHALADGTLWPRYVPSLVYGYGSPMFNYYSPLSLYPMQAMYWLGLTFKQAWLVGMMAYTFTAALGAYLLGQRWGGMVAGFVAAAAYLYAPYSLFDAVGRGTVSEYASLAALPFVWWTLKRLADTGRRLDFVGSVAAFALFVPIHNVITLHGALVTGLYALLLAGTSPQRVRTLIRLGGALALGMGLTAFFWLPALTETRFVKLDAITDVLPDIDVTRNLLTLETILAPTFTADPTQMQPPTPIALAWPQLVLSVAALLVVSFDRRWRHLRALMVWGALLVVALVFMNLEASAGLWARLPLIRYSQFPWRLVGIASLIVALMAGIGAALLIARVRRDGVQMALIVGIVAVVTLYGVPWTVTRYQTEVDPRSVSDALTFERESGFIGTSSFGEYVPIWSFEYPDPDKLAPRFADSAIIARFDPPDGVTVNRAAWTHTGASLDLALERETALVFDWFFFIGWQARLDGQAIGLAPTEPHGLITVTVPAGLHTLEIALALTERQTLALGLSGASVVLVLLALLIRPLWRRGTESQATVESTPRALAWVMLITGVALFSLKVWGIDTTASPLRRERFAAGESAGVETAIGANFGDRITLIGADLLTERVDSNGTIALDLYWRLTAGPIQESLSTVISLHDAEGVEVATQVNWQPGGLSTPNWREGAYLQERIRFVTPLGTPPDVYTLQVSVINPSDGQAVNLPILDASGNAVNVSVEAARVTVTRPDSVRAGDDAKPMLDFGAVALVDAPRMGGEYQAGAALDLRLLWRALESPLRDLNARVVWQSAAGDAALSEPFALVRAWPSSTWRAGESWLGLQRVFVPAALDGLYTVSLEVDGVRHPLGEMGVIAPERVFDAPRAAYPLDVAWANGIRLLGWDESADGVTLYWQTDAPLNQTLRVFVQVFDADGVMIGSSDAEPSRWGRAVTGWLVGEVVTDAHTLTLSDDAQVFVGWYDPRTMQRVTLSDGGDAYRLR